MLGQSLEQDMLIINELEAELIRALRITQEYKDRVAKEMIMYSYPSSKMKERGALKRMPLDLKQTLNKVK